jgi:hypothetical protein
MPSIGIRYCGGCNPQIDRSNVIRKLEKDLKERAMKLDFTTNRKSTVDIILLINGCMHACLEEQYLREGNSPQFISIKGEMVESQYVKEEHIPEFLIKKIVDFLNSPSH